MRKAKPKRAFRLPPHGGVSDHIKDHSSFFVRFASHRFHYSINKNLSQAMHSEKEHFVNSKRILQKKAHISLIFLTCVV